jgi:hypothetical protein
MVARAVTWLIGVVLKSKHVLGEQNVTPCWHEIMYRICNLNRS